MRLGSLFASNPRSRGPAHPLSAACPFSKSQMKTLLGSLRDVLLRKNPE